MKIIILILFILNNIYAIKDINKEVIIKNKKNTKAKVNIKNYNLTQKAIINKKHYIKIEKYDPKRIYKLNIRPLISTQIKLLKDEVIAGYILGDKTNFKIEVLKEKATTYKLDNIIVITAVSTGVDTNLVIYTKQGNTYNFHLRAIRMHSHITPTFSISFYKKGKYQKEPIPFKDTLSDPEFLIEEIRRLEIEKKEYYNFNKTDLATLQFDYKFKDDKIVFVANDNKSTYFKIRENQPIPKIYYHDNATDTYKSIATSSLNNTIKINKINKKWKLVFVTNSLFSNTKEYEVKKKGSIYDLYDKEYIKNHREIKTNFKNLTKDYEVCEDESNSNFKLETILNDEKFIYLKFNFKDAQGLPNIYTVVMELDSPIQTETIGNMIIVKGLKKLINLNVSNEHLCIKRIEK